MSDTPRRNGPETEDRLRRIETRLTKFMEFMGFDTQTRKPVYSLPDSLDECPVIEIPSQSTSLKDIITEMATHDATLIRVQHKGEFVCFVDVDFVDAGLEFKSDD